MRDIELILKDILQSIKSIQNFVRGMTFEQFEEDDKTSSAVLRKLEIIGEAAKQTPDNIRAACPGVPWKEMAGMRDRLIHLYFGVDYALVWKTVMQKLPIVQTQLEKYLADS